MMKMKMVLASHNPGKQRELQTAIKPFDIELIPQTQFGVEEIEETGKTFIENALQKARLVSSISELPTIADDSGLVVPALNDQPGIYSARYAGKAATSETNIEKLLDRMIGIPLERRHAYFYCSMVYLEHADDPTPLISEGRWWGLITTASKGSAGFGYDPIFFVPSENKTAAELSLTRKNEISHRGIALRNFIKHITEKLQ